MATQSATPYLILGGGMLLLGGGIAYAVVVSRRQALAAKPEPPALPAAPVGNPGIVPPPYGSPVPVSGGQPGPLADPQRVEASRRLAEAQDAQRSVEELRRRAAGLPPLDQIPGVNLPGRGDSSPPATPQPPQGLARTLKQGSSGEDVRGLQIVLNSLGANLATDGSFGPGTKAAVQAFQRQRGLVPDGVVGPTTWAALRAATSAPPPGSIRLS